MKLMTLVGLAFLVVAGTCADAAAFGRGMAGIPPHGYAGGHAGVAAGPYGGVHSSPYIPPHPAYVPPQFYAPPHGGNIVGGYHQPPAYIHPGAGGATVISPGSVHAGGAIFTPPANPGHFTHYVGPSAIAAIGAGVRGYGPGYPYFTPAWRRLHPLWWWPRVWWGGFGIWYVPAWDTLAPYVGVVGPPIIYDYGSSAVIVDGVMYLNGSPLGTAAAYAADATAIADTGRAAAPPDADEWQPLGIFGLIQGNESMAQRIFQLAVNKAGIVRGNYYDAVSDSHQLVYGAVDKKTQRVAWTVGDRKDIVYEAGLSNLMRKETTVLIHYGKDRTNQMILVRLEQPPGT